MRLLRLVVSPHTPLLIGWETRLEQEVKEVQMRNEGLDILKKASIETNDIWKMAGQPRSGPIFDKRQSARRQYRKCLIRA